MKLLFFFGCLMAMLCAAASISPQHTIYETPANFDVFQVGDYQLGPHDELYFELDGLVQVGERLVDNQQTECPFYLVTSTAGIEYRDCEHRIYAPDSQGPNHWCNTFHLRPAFVAEEAPTLRVDPYWLSST